MWKKNAQPTPANIRKRVSAAQEAIEAAMDLVKARSRNGLSRPAEYRKSIKALDQAYAWLVDVQRCFTGRG